MIAFLHENLMSFSGTMIQSLAWNNSCNMLAALSDDWLLIYCYPNAIYADKDLLPRVIDERDSR